MTAIGVVGGYGSVGRATVAHLRAWGLGPIVVAGRDAARADVVVDLDDPGSLDRFCASVRLVVNCTAAPAPTRAALAKAAASAGVPCVDPGGDEPVDELLSGQSTTGTWVLSAGMLPGLTGLLPRLLVGEASGRVVGYAGGQDRFSLGGAADYLDVVRGSAGRTFAVWRDGARVTRAGVPALEGEVPFFTEQASAVPYLSPELERLAGHLGLAELVFYTVFPGARLRETLAATGTGAVDAEAVVRASELDLFGRSRYQRLAFQRIDEPGRPTVVLTGQGSSELTGAMAAMTVMAVLDGMVPAGLHFAAEVLDPAWAVRTLRTAEAVTALRTFDAGPATPMPPGTPVPVGAGAPLPARAGVPVSAGGGGTEGAGPGSGEGMEEGVL